MSVVTFYRNDPNAPKPNMRAHLGSNCIITCAGKLLLERRRDSATWGLVGGGVKKTEEEPGRIAAFRDGSVWRMVIVVFGLELPEERSIRLSNESKEARFFTREEVRNLQIPVTHSDIVEELFLNI